MPPLRLDGTPAVYHNGVMIPAGQAQVPVTNQALNYGTGVFEGIRAYADHSGGALNLFRLSDHLERLHRSARLMRLDLDLTTAQLTDLVIELLVANDTVRDTYVRPLAYKGALLPGTGFGVRLAGVSTEFAVTTVPMGSYTNPVGLRCAVSSWRRIPGSALPAAAKITGGYANNALAMDQAQAAGLDDAVMLNAGGTVAEASTANIFVVRDGRLITPPPGADILPGITRATVLELAARELALPVVEREVQPAELYGADECFLAGTGVQIAPVVEVDRRPVGNGEVGPLTSEIRQLYTDAVRGVLPRYHHWLTPVPVPDRNGGTS
ncbi:branched-chain amino acid transaminase [Rhodococcus sp. D2-41]|uniref:Branched-chain-amino-acid aminotransferase n=1 Tax=Speluncibacter jeojiensis TaxID=2710754 RepID=A0A9X4M048_9ACTN|nr:branched-chain amino acid transaminase [Rhodococcus sp. D2-41]MDG3010825.1 branched-chain amino acid transaminase [Rhodococcus sp. D2-41]MDG3013797.1 branched-chain amino acid transaminase [Corynebacteriales bacterium D3-21]